MTDLNQTKLVLTIRPLNEELDHEGISTYEPSDTQWKLIVYRFDNGAIQVPHNNDYDEFYSSIDDYAACINDMIENVQECNTFTASVKLLRYEVIRSKNSYGKWAIPSNVVELIKIKAGKGN